MNAREVLVQVANRVGFPPPAQAQGLAEWADSALDAALVRGSPAWAEASAHVLDALQAAAGGGEAAAQAALERARDRVRAAGRPACSCPPSGRGRRVTVSGGRSVCVRCGGRAQ